MLQETHNLYTYISNIGEGHLLCVDMGGPGPWELYGWHLLWKISALGHKAADEH